jgi:hypothetical protein
VPEGLPPVAPAPVAVSRGDSPPPAWASPVRQAPRSVWDDLVNPPIVNPRFLPGRDNLPTARRIVARVNGEPILEEDLAAAAYHDTHAALPEDRKLELLKVRLNQIIDRELVLQCALPQVEKNGHKRAIEALVQVATREFERQWLEPMMRSNNHTDKKKFERFLDDNGLPVEVIRRQWERDFMAIECLRPLIGPHLAGVDLPTVLAWYDKHPEVFHVEASVTWQHIFIALTGHWSHESTSLSAPPPRPKPISREEAGRLADGLLVRIRNGEDFVRLARQYDDGNAWCSTNAQGMGQIRGQIWPREAEESLFRMKPGEVTRFDTRDGAHVVKLLARRDAYQKPFDHQVQKQIYEKLCREIFDRERERILTQLRGKSTIEYAPGYPGGNR